MSLQKVVSHWAMKNLDAGPAARARIGGDWTWKHWFFFNSVPIKTLLEDDYFFGWRGRQMYSMRIPGINHPTHYEDIVRLFTLKTPERGRLPGNKKSWEFCPEGVPDSVKKVCKDFFENNVRDVKIYGKDYIKIDWKGQGRDLRVGVFEEGTRAGKTWKAGLIFCILIFKNVIIKDFNSFYPSIAAQGGKIGFSAMSRTEQRSRDVLFKEIMEPILHSDFFLDYFPPNVTLEQVQSFKRNPGVLKFPNGIGLASGSGMNTELENLGFTIIGALADEINFYEYVLKSIRKEARADRGEFDAARIVYEDLYTRINNQFGYKGRWPAWALLLLISSAGYAGDMTDRLRKEANNNPEIMFVNRTVYEARPHTFSGEFFDFDTASLSVVDESDTISRYEKRFGKSYLGELVRVKDSDLQE